jgi:hypothetical protein
MLHLKKDFRATSEEAEQDILVTGCARTVNIIILTRGLIVKYVGLIISDTGEIVILV